MNLKAAATITFLVLTVSCANKLKPALSEDLRPRNTPIQVGEAAPNFTLSNQHDQKVMLSSTRGSMPTVLVFYRGNW